MPRLTIINRRPSPFTLSDPSGYTTFTALVPANDERSFPIDTQVALAIENKLRASRDAGDIFFSLENDLDSNADNSKRAVFEVDSGLAQIIIPPEADVILLWTTATSIAANIQFVLPPIGKVRDGHQVEIRDAIGIADTSALRVSGGAYQFDLDTNILASMAEGDFLVLTNDTAGVSRNGSYPVFRTSNGGPGSYLVSVLSLIPGGAGNSGTVDVSVLDSDGRVKLAPTTVTANTVAPYPINRVLTPYNFGNTKYCGVNLIAQPTLGFWSAVKLVG
jgi:hypothetical protein